MKQFYKHIMVAALLWTGVAAGVQAQLVINYQNDKGGQETKMENLLKVDKDGNSFLINMIQINRVNYISRFVSDNTNEGKIDLPEDSNLDASDLTVVGGDSEVTVDDNGNFQTTSNNITAYNSNGQVVYRSYVTMESGDQMCQAELNATETAVSLLMPMFTSIFQGMTDEVMARLKTLISDLDETKALAEAIDKSIVSYGYLNMDDISSAYEAAATQVARLSGLDQTVNLSRRSAKVAARAAINEKVTKDGITIRLNQLEKATVERTNKVTGATVAIDGYKGYFDVWNKSRLAYSSIYVGQKMRDGRIIPTYYGDGTYILPPVRMGQIINASSTWDDIKNFLAGSGAVGNTVEGDTYTESKLSNITLSLATADDAVMVLGSSSDTFIQIYNVVRTNTAMVIADIFGSTDPAYQDMFYQDFAQYLNSFAKLPNADNTYDDYYSYYYSNIMYDNERSAQEKIIAIFELTFKALVKYMKVDGATYSPVSTIVAGRYYNAQTEKIFNNYEFYRSVIAQIGDKSMGVIGLNEEDTGIPVEGLDIAQRILTESELYAEAQGMYDQFVAIGNGKGREYGGELFYKGMWMSGMHPTLDSQATGWDSEWNKQKNTANSSELSSAFDAAYGVIGYANILLEDIARSGLSTLKKLEGEARALRDFCYIYLAETWGRVALRTDGETLENIQNKPYPDSDIEVWDFIIEDLTKAADLLDWQPRDGQYGRCTKGMALSYLGEAYLWKAYRQRANGLKDRASLTAAKETLKKVIDSQYYRLSPSYASLWSAEKAWPEEAVWQFANDMNPNPGNDWARNDWLFMQWYAACPLCGGWGSLYFSWELYFLFEQGDLRRDASFCTAAVSGLPQEYQGAGYGKNPYLGDRIDWYTFKFNNGEFAPAVWTLKYWRMKKPDWGSPYCPVHVYFKRYASVLLDYAECLFRLNGGDDTEAWNMVSAVRNRAFGGQEAVNAKSYYNQMTEEGVKINLTGTPETLCLPFKGKVEPWQVAIGQERRKEFNCEWNIRADLQRLEFMQAHMDCNYPKGVGITDNANDWHTWRTWDFNPQALVFPIPTNELERNPSAK